VEEIYLREELGRKKIKK